MCLLFYLPKIIFQERIFQFFLFFIPKTLSSAEFDSVSQTKPNQIKENTTITLLFLFASTEYLKFRVSSFDIKISVFLFFFFYCFTFENVYHVVIPTDRHNFRLMNKIHVTTFQWKAISHRQHNKHVCENTRTTKQTTTLWKRMALVQTERHGIDNTSSQREKFCYKKKIALVIG